MRGKKSEFEIVLRKTPSDKGNTKNIPSTGVDIGV
jgi:hypothetical protein